MPMPRTCLVRMWSTRSSRFGIASASHRAEATGDLTQEHAIVGLGDEVHNIDGLRGCPRAPGKRLASHATVTLIAAR